MQASPMTSLPVRRRQSPVEIGQDVVDVFDAYSQANQSRRYAGCGLLRFVQLGVGGRGRVDSQALRITDVCQVREKLQALDECTAG